MSTRRSSIPLTTTHGAKEYLRVAATWDRGSRRVREQLLQDFVTACVHKTEQQLDADFAQGASLFLTRITAWLRLTYLLNYNLALQMQAISVFLTASGGQRFLLEFVEVGGVLTLLEVLELIQVRETDKAEALKLLIHVASAGRKYKEFICDNFGVRTVADCLAKSKNETTQDHARHLLQELGTGNPKYLMQVYKSLLSLVTVSNNSVMAQQYAGQALRYLLPSISNIHISIVDATISLLKSPHIEIQYEGYEILKELLSRHNLQETIIGNLISILQTHVEDMDETDMLDVRMKRGGIIKSIAGESTTNGTGGGMVAASGDKQRMKEGYHSLFVQQAYAARLLSIVAATTPEMAVYMIHQDVILALLTVVANVANQDAQRAAAQLLQFLADTYSDVVAALKEQFGVTFYEFFRARPDTFYRELTKEQVRYLRRSTQRVRRNRNARQEEEQATMDNDGSVKFEEMKLTDLQRGPDGVSTPGTTTDTCSLSISPSDSNYRTENAVTPISYSGANEMLSSLKPSMPSTLVAMRDYDDTKSPTDATVEDISEDSIKAVYTPFQPVTVTTSLSGSKFGGPSNELSLDKFNTDLDKFRTANKYKPARIGATERAPEVSLKIDANNANSRLIRAEFPDFEQEMALRFPHSKDGGQGVSVITPSGSSSADNDNSNHETPNDNSSSGNANLRNRLEH